MSGDPPASNPAEPAPSNTEENVKPGSIVTEDGEEEWFIERIVDERRRGGKRYYRVRWLGWGHQDDSWLPAEELSRCEALDEWESGL